MEGRDDEREPVHDLIQVEASLRSSHDFLVDSVDGREIGVVDEVEVDVNTGRVRAIDVCSGWFGRRRSTIPVEAIVAVYPGLRRLVVSSDWAERSEGRGGA
ncbi:MAG TPA: PRC-barrel domain-containing protein [Gaiellaceae bacterium]|nr:PRC-barrel domain-containing protein [Gaiellaceae bacterium]